MKVRFLDIFEDVTKFGTKIPKENYLTEGKYPIFDQGQEYIAGYTNEIEGIYLDIPAILFGDHTRIIKYINIPCFLGADGVKLLKAKRENVNYKYLYYALCHAHIPNTGYNRHFKWLKEISIIIPSNKEQQKIADILDKVGDLITLRKRQLEKLDELVKSRFVEMFGTYPKNEMQWNIGTIKDVILEAKYGSSRPAVEGGQYPYLRMNNITYEGELDLSNIKYIDIPENELSKCTVQRGDVLFNRTNSKELVGKTCVYNKDEMMVLAGFVIRVRVNDKALPEFLSAFLNTDFSKQMLLGMCKAAIGQANINAQEMQNIGIYIPPINIQTCFKNFKEQVNKQKSSIQQSLDKLEVLKKALMQEYFG